MDYVAFGKNVRKQRTNLGMTQEQLAEKLNRSNSHIGKIENGMGGFSVDTLVDLANALHTTVDQLLMDSYDYGELIYMREINERVARLPLKTRITACEMLVDLMDVIEKSHE
jgi:transcriptional regulator with XRE-family HTH domain